MITAAADTANLIRQHEKSVRQIIKLLAPAHREAIEYHLLLLQEKYAADSATLVDEISVRRAQGGFQVTTALLQLLQHDEVAKGRPKPDGHRPSAML